MLQFYISLVIQMLKLCLAHFELSIHVHQKKGKQRKKEHQLAHMELNHRNLEYKLTYTNIPSVSYYSIVKRGTLNKKAKNTTLIASL